MKKFFIVILCGLLVLFPALTGCSGEEKTVKITDTNDYLSNGETKYNFDADVYFVPCVGQSLAINTNAGPSTFTETHRLSYDMYLSNTNLQDMNTGFCEGFELMAEKYGIEIPDNFKIATCVVGTGGTSINTFVKGTGHYSQVISAIKAAYNTCKENNLTMIVPGFMWTQGEEDMRTGGDTRLYGKNEWDPFEYSNKLAQMIEDLNADIKEITGQSNDIFCYSYQVASHTIYRKYPRIALEQADLALKNDHMILAKVMYDLDYDVNDQVHAPAASYRSMGNYYGAAAFVTSVLHRDFQYTHVTNVTENGNQVILDYEVPYKPLTLDTELVNNLEDGNYGFNVYNMPDELSISSTRIGISESETKITKVEITGETQITLTLSRPLQSDDILTYGINGCGWQNITGNNPKNLKLRSGHIDGPRGCVRDSNPLVNENEGAVYSHMYSWMPIFEYRPNN